MDGEMNSLGLTERPKVDEVSGNEVPPGALPEEVRDDVPAKLSGGEYVIPADVLRYYGVGYFERLRKKAKEALAEMDSEGRIGGKPQPEMEEEDDDIPFGDDELMFEEEEMPQMAEGGMLPPSTFNPNSYGLGFSTFGNTSGATAPQEPKAETKTYINPATGARISIQMIDGKPQQPIPPGFYPEGDPALVEFRPEQGDFGEERDSQTRQNTESRTPDWGKDKNWSSMSVEDALGLARSRLENDNKALEVGAQIAGALPGPLGMIGKGLSIAADLRPVAEVNGLERALRESGNPEAADAVGKMNDEFVGKLNPGLRAVEGIVANGSQIAKGLMNNGYKGTERPSVGSVGSGNSRSSVRGGSTGDRTSPSVNRPSVGEKPSLSYGNISPSKPDNPRTGNGYSLGTPEGEDFNNGLAPQKKDEDKTATEDRRAKGGLIQRRKKK